MEGVTILNQFEVVTETVFSWSEFSTGFLIGMCVGLIMGIIFGLSEWDWFAFLFMFLFAGLVVGGFIGVLFGYVVNPTPVDYETHYEVTINEEVNMKEFMDKYEVVETRGLIYTVREK